MTDSENPYISIDLEYAELDEKSQTYNVTKLVKGMYFDMFLLLQETLNFTATLHRRKDGKWGGKLNIFEIGTIEAAGLPESLLSGFSEMIMTTYEITFALLLLTLLEQQDNK